MSKCINDKYQKDKLFGIYKMNATNSMTSTGANGYEYSTYILGAMFVVSEVMPLLKNKSNGVLHAVLCLINGSKCMLTKVEEAIEKQVEAATPEV